MNRSGVTPTLDALPTGQSPLAASEDTISVELSVSENNDANVEALDTTDASPDRVNEVGSSKTGKIALLLVVLVIAMSSVGWIANQSVSPSVAGGSSDPIDRPPLPVELVRVGSVAGPVLSQRYAGLLVAKQASALSFERAGRVTTIKVREGDRVKKGDLLAELDQEDLDAAADRITSELKAAEAVLAELVAGPRPQAIRAAQAKVEELTARVKLAEIDANRQKQLATQSATSRSELDAAVFGLQATENNLLAAKALLEELDEGTRGEQIAAQRSKCDSITASLREIDASRSDSRILAPFDGTISSRAIDEGVVVAAGGEVLNLVSETVEAQIGLPPEIASSLKPGQPVLVGLRDTKRPAWVDRAEPTVRRDTRTRVVFLRFHSHDSDPATTDDRCAELQGQGWVAGEVVEMQTHPKDESIGDDKYWLPRSALVRGTRGLWSALVVPGDSGSGVCQRRAVEVLKTDGSLALVQGMIQTDERVIRNGLHRLTAGMHVTPVESVARDSSGEAVRSGAN